MTLSERIEGFEQLLGQWSEANASERCLQAEVQAGQRAVALGWTVNPPERRLLALEEARREVGRLYAEMTRYCEMYAY